MLVKIYVDEIIFGSTDEVMVDHFAKLMTSKFQTSMNREIIFILGLQIQQVPEGIFIHQQKYSAELLKKYSMDNCSSVKVHMAIGFKIATDSTGMTGYLLYLSESRPNIIFTTGLCARYQADPKMSHLNAVIPIFRYLN